MVNDEVLCSIRNLAEMQLQTEKSFLNDDRTSLYDDALKVLDWLNEDIEYYCNTCGTTAADEKLNCFSCGAWLGEEE